MCHFSSGVVRIISSWFGSISASLFQIVIRLFVGMSIWRLCAWRGHSQERCCVRNQYEQRVLLISGIRARDVVWQKSHGVSRTKCTRSMERSLHSIFKIRQIFPTAQRSRNYGWERDCVWSPTSFDLLLYIYSSMPHCRRQSQLCIKYKMYLKVCSVFVTAS